MRKKPAPYVQLDMFDENFNSEVGYVRSSKKRSSFESWKLKTDVLWCRPVDPSR